MPRVTWEGQTYRLDLVAAERVRLSIVRGKQGGPTLDLALSIERFGRTLTEPASPAALQAAVGELQVLTDQSAAQLTEPARGALAPGIELARTPAELVSSALDDLRTITEPPDARRGAHAGALLLEASDILLGTALMSFAYAIDIGDPDGAALLAGNVAFRHDFGLGRREAAGRGRSPWSQPHQDFRPGVPWHVSGALLGLDVALAPLALQRLMPDHPLEAPTLPSIEREAMAVGVALLDPLRLTNADRDAIADAVARGQARVDAVQNGQESLDRIADVLALDGWRRREISRALSDAPQTLGDQFSLVDLLTLGGGAAARDINAWGTTAVHSDGCLCTKLPQARAWRVLAGRPQVPMMAATMGDLNLAVAVKLRELDLPAALARPILTLGMQDFIDEVTLANSGDWWSLSRYARRLERRRVEDYVAAAAAVNGPLVPVNSGASREP
jgi:hypothetical protein